MTIDLAMLWAAYTIGVVGLGFAAALAGHRRVQRRAGERR